MSIFKCLNKIGCLALVLSSTYLTSCSNGQKSQPEVTNSDKPVKEHNGKILFSMYCSSCHQKYMKTLGPELNNVAWKLPEPQKDYFLKYVKNNKKMREAGDQHSLDIYKEFQGLEMPAYEESLKESEILEIYDYLIMTDK